jgi:hypothetical protein
LLGLRTLRALLGLAESNIDELRFYIAVLIKERAAVTEPDMPSRELMHRADEALIWLTLACTFGVIKKISFAVGHHHLGDTYDKLLEQHESTSIHLVDLAIKLEHFSVVPNSEIDSLSDKVEGNAFSATILQRMVADFLYLYRVDFRTLNRLGAKFKIEGISKPQFLLPDEKKN